jgi:hypothetical protein
MRYGPLFHRYGNPGCAEQARIDEARWPSGVFSSRMISQPSACNSATICSRLEFALLTIVAVFALLVLTIDAVFALLVLMIDAVFALLLVMIDAVLALMSFAIAVVAEVTLAVIAVCAAERSLWM